MFSVYVAVIVSINSLKSLLSKQIATRGREVYSLLAGINNHVSLLFCTLNVFYRCSQCAQSCINA